MATRSPRPSSTWRSTSTVAILKVSGTSKSISTSIAVTPALSHRERGLLGLSPSSARHVVPAVLPANEILPGAVDAQFVVDVLALQQRFVVVGGRHVAEA